MMLELVHGVIVTGCSLPEAPQRIVVVWLTRGVWVVTGYSSLSVCFP